MRAALAGLLGVVLAGAASAAPAKTPIGDAPPAVSADVDLLQRLMAEARVESAPPPPPWSAYLEDLSRAVVRVLARRASPLLDWAASHGRVVVWLAWGLFAALAVLLLVTLVRAVVRPRRRRERNRPEVVSAHVLPAVPERDRDRWRAELESRLRAGDVARALEALWWWLACSVAGREIDASWTTRELLDRSGRHDLSTLGRALDRLTYGPDQPAPADVRDLLDRLSAALP